MVCSILSAHFLASEARHDEDDDDEDDDGGSGGAGADADEAGAVFAVDDALASGAFGVVACGEFFGDGFVEFLEAGVAGFELCVGEIHVEQLGEGFAGVAEFSHVLVAFFLFGDVGDDGADFVGEVGGDGGDVGGGHGVLPLLHESLAFVEAAAA